MKKLVIIIFIFASVQYLPAQNLLDIYRKGTVRLVSDTEYAQDNDWDKIFVSYYDTTTRPLGGKVSLGNRKNIVMLPDGSVVVSHAYRNYYSLFSGNGKFVKEFGVTKTSGKPFEKVNAIQGVMNHTFFTELDNMGKMLCFDFDGNYKKTLTLDYMTKNMISLTDNKIAVVGWAIWKDRFRDFVAIVDFNTNEQKIVWDHFTEKNKSPVKVVSPSYMAERSRALQSVTYSINRNTIRSSAMIAFVRNNLVVAVPTTGDIFVYDMQGNLVSKEKIEWERNYISVEEQKELKRKAIEQYRKIELTSSKKASEEEIAEAKETILKEMEDELNNIKDPIPLPFFSTIIKDSDENLLFFGFPKEKGKNKFNVWIHQGNGKSVCQSSFECDDYDLVITPSKMVFHNGYIYALQTLKQTTGNPLRLVRFKITN